MPQSGAGRVARVPVRLDREVPVHASPISFFSGDAHGPSKGRSPARRLPPLSQPLPATGLPKRSHGPWLRRRLRRERRR